MDAVADRRYIAILAALAAAILIVGSSLRPAKSVAVPTPSETVALRRRVQREDLRDMASYLASRSQDASRHVIAIEHGRSAVNFGAPGQMLAPGEPGNPAPLVLLPAPGPMPIPPFPSVLHGERWTVMVGRRTAGDPLWRAALNSGRQPAECRGVAIEELILNAPLTGLPLGSALFDLDGMLAGVIADCGDTRTAVSAVSIPKLLDAFRDPAVRFLPLYGFEAVPTGDDTAALFDANGLFVREVRQASPAARNGLRAGDLIVSSRDDLHQLLSSAAGGTTVDLPILRNGRKRTVPWVAAPASLQAGIQALATEGVPISVEPGTPAQKAGLRNGDRVIEVAGRPVTRAADLTRLLARFEEPLLVIYQHNDSQLATVVRP